MTRTWVEVDLGSATENFEKIKKLTKSRILAVVKSDGYGHGSIEMAKFFLSQGAYMLGVATVDEAVYLRKHAIDAPILVLAQPDVGTIDQILEHDITTTVFSYEFAKKLSEEAVRQEKVARVHIKVDTGMNRVGLLAEDEDSVDIAEKIVKEKNIFTEGIFTHFSMADDDREYTTRQFNLFTEFNKKLTERGINIPIRHACNSAALLLYPEMHLDMVRLGIILYGMYPAHNKELTEKVELVPVMRLKSRITHIKKVKAGAKISYGGTYTTQKDMVIATVPIGYADGYSRALSGKVSMMVEGHRVEVVGNICMDQCMIDITNVQNIHVGDEVLVFGKTDKGQIPVEELAKTLGTINYEPPCIIARRVPRIYIKGDEVIKTQYSLV